MQSSVGHQRTVSASPPSFSFTRWRHLRTGTLTIIAVADATLIFAMKNSGRHCIQHTQILLRHNVTAIDNPLNYRLFIHYHSDQVKNKNELIG